MQLFRHSSSFSYFGKLLFGMIKQVNFCFSVCHSVSYREQLCKKKWKRYLSIMKNQNTAQFSLYIHGGLAQIPNFADAQVLGIAWLSIFMQSKYSLPYTLNICRLLRIAQSGCYINSCCTILLGNKIKYLYILNPESNLFRYFPFSSPFFYFI